MATSRYDLLDQHDEDELHKNRQLPVEIRPFQRISKHVALAKLPATKLPTPPPEGAPESQDGASAASTGYMGQVHGNAAAMKEDIQLDFAAFDSTITRLQFLATANEKERERYATDRSKILETMEAVRSSNASLRTQLDEARATLAQRKSFDELADRITSNRMLRPRAEQAVNLDKLAEECDELQRESETYGVTWRERKEQFDKLVGEGVNLLRLIRDEKEEVERREGMDEEDGDEDGDNNNSTPGGGKQGGSQSGSGTPARHGDDNATPRPGSSSGRTPRQDSPGAGGSGGGATDNLKPQPDVGGSFSRGGSLAPSLRGIARHHGGKDGEPEGGEDVEMGEPAQVADTPMTEGGVKEETPQITVDAPTGPDDKMDTT
ncbi:hypothetical protein PG994_011419 [Apiospora phragmitis]|uniref:Tho complex subunit 7 n=1 Tax=Apiospora phragmitis TaxID=2905665 RepID=A0ABR1TSU7_9PEZI